MKVLEFDFYSLVLNQLKDSIGYVVFMIDYEDSTCAVFHYPTKEEFLNDFKIEGNTVIPINNIEDDYYRIGGIEVYIEDESHLNLVIDGTEK